MKKGWKLAVGVAALGGILLFYSGGPAPAFHPELRGGRFLPRLSFGPRSTRWVRALGRRLKTPALTNGVTVEEVAALRRALFG